MSVGENRQWNHLTLDELLSIPEDGSQPLPTESSGLLSPVLQSSAEERAPSAELPLVRPRIYVTESRLWGCLTGHGIDYQKVTRFEWLALVGIASVMEDGILQGDLTRLVGQDKRSLPKRTDALARKGYIVKRPILARGCKTSKLWLKPFAPTVQIKKHSTETIAEICNTDFPRDAIVGDLEPVPWRHHWSGNTIDYATLGRSIMGVVKEFGVIRYQDLRMKLGVAGHPWQMKVVTRTCRFFIELGLLQYVTASMGNRIFRDCIKFKRDITPEDLAAFISGGGSAFKVGNNHEPKKLSAKMPKDDAIGSNPTERWCPDKPLTTGVLEVILGSGEKGITNKGLAFNTIGVFFERHVAAISTAVSLKNLQPDHLRQFRARKEFCRSGRFAFYKFFPDEKPPRASPYGTQSSETIYGFGPSRLGRPSPNSEPHTRSARAAVSGRKRPFHFDAVSDGKGKKKRKTGMAVSDTVSIENEQIVPARKRGRPRKEPASESSRKPKRKVPSASNGKPFTCEKCGGSWKNDVGLKYHQRKSRTPCNPDFVAKPLPRVNRVSHRGHSRKVPGATGRAVESKALRNFRNWKGDSTIQVRPFTPEQPPTTGPSPVRDDSSNNTQISNDFGSLMAAQEPFIGGLIDDCLVQTRDSAIDLSHHPDRPSPSSKKRNQGTRKTRGPCLSPSRKGEVLLQRAAQDSSTLALGNPTQTPERSSVHPEPENTETQSSVTPPVTANGISSAKTPGIASQGADDLQTKLRSVPAFEPSPALLDTALIGDARDVIRAKEIIKYLIKNNDGAFPSRISLWHAILKVWHKTFTGDNIPTYTISQRAVKELVKKKEAVENTFAFRNSAGTISDCYLLVEAGIDPNLPRFQDLKARMKESHPRPYIPPEFSHASTDAPTDDETGGPQWGSGRRKHVMSVEVLDAPVYMTQAAQRRSSLREGSKATRRAGRAFKVTPASAWSQMTREWRHANGYKQIRFLKPNTHLGEEGSTGAVDPRSLAIPPQFASPSDGPSQNSKDDFEGSTDGYPDIRFTECVEIEQANSEWPTADNDFFESEGCSFTLVGPMPDREAVAQHMRQPMAYSSLGKTYGSMYGSFLAQEQPDYLFARPVGPSTTRATPARGRPRIRRDRLLPRPRLKERILTGIEDESEIHQNNLLVESVRIDGFTVEEALTVAFIAVRTLLGGSSKAIDWGLLVRLFPGQSLNDLRRFWIKLSKDRVHFLTSFTEKFQDAFLKAYENGELPPLDYDNIPGYDWQSLILWAIELRRTNFVKLPIKKSGSGERAMTRGFTLDDQPTQPRHWHERFYHQQASIFSRFELSTSEAAALEAFSRKQDSPSNMEPTPAQVAMSWVRALSTTPPEKCPPELVKSKLATLAASRDEVNAILDEAVTSLNTRRIITKRIRSKPYMLSRPFQSNLAKFGQEKKLRAASEFKAVLDDTFRRGDPFKIPFLTEDGANMALINLYACGRLSITGTNVPDIPLGFKPGNYESRKMPKSHLLFGLVATPSNRYLFDEDIDILKLAKDTLPPVDAPSKLTPFWCDFFGEINFAMWTKLLGLVCFMLAIRGSMPFPMLCLQTKAYLEEFDLRLLVDWGKEIGLFAEDPKSGGITVTEWWWLVVGRQTVWPEPTEEKPQGPPKEKAPRPRGRPRKKKAAETEAVAVTAEVQPAQQVS